MHPRQEPLLRAIERMYAMFTPRVPAKPILNVRRPRRAAEPAEIEALAMHAITTNGSVDEYLHWLPRVLETSALNQSGGLPGHSPLWIAQKLALLKDALNDEQHRAVDEIYFEAFCRNLTLSPDEVEITNWLHAIAFQDRYLERVLGVWVQSSYRNSVGHLIELASLLFQMDADVRIAVNEYFHEISREQSLRLADWITEGAAIEKLRSFEILASPHQQWEVNRLSVLVHWLSSQGKN